jgi:hypothetical protein
MREDYQAAGKMLGSLAEELKLARARHADHLRKQQADPAGGIVVSRQTNEELGRTNERIKPWDEILQEDAEQIRRMELAEAGIKNMLRDRDHSEVDKYIFNINVAPGVTLEEAVELPKKTKGSAGARAREGVPSVVADQTDEKENPDVQ